MSPELSGSSKKYSSSEVDQVFALTLQPSFLSSYSGSWTTSSQLCHSGEQFTPDAFLSVTNYLLENPNRNSANVFRADILYDDDKSLESLKCEEDLRPNLINGDTTRSSTCLHDEYDLSQDVPGFTRTRSVLRRFIPRNERRDSSLDQSCYFYERLEPMTETTESNSVDHGTVPTKQHNLVVYIPHVTSQEDMPWYHPMLRAMALLYVFDPSLGGKGSGTLSLHFLPFSNDFPNEIPYRLQRTLLAVLATQLRFARKPFAGARTKQPWEKDSIIPQHDVQNTYARLKEKYTFQLVQNWVEKTEPSKHVFEDISIAAFLIELWKHIYNPRRSEISVECDGSFSENELKSIFPGFVDIACGNGVLVHILLSEGYTGWGFDARHRKTWSTFPKSTQERLRESVCVPKPFMEIIGPTIKSEPNSQDGPQINAGIFEENPFIISNHADELTLWTPLLGVLSNPVKPLPFLAIPCCSHGISGARYRYPAPKDPSKKSKANRQKQRHDNCNGITQCSNETSINTITEDSMADHEEIPNQNPQPATGDLQALRASKFHSQADPTNLTSMYGALTAKTVRIAEELGYAIDMTKMRIPSTRNIGIVGGLRPMALRERRESIISGVTFDGYIGNVETKIGDVVQRECARDGGLEAAAKLWFDRASALTK